MANWSIRITKDGFVPVQPGSGLGQPLQVNGGDNITWNNMAEQPQLPWQLDPNGNPIQFPLPPGAYLICFFCTEIAPGDVSSPIFNVPKGFAGTTLNYCSKTNPKLTGSIKMIT